MEFSMLFVSPIPQMSHSLCSILP